MQKQQAATPMLMMQPLGTDAGGLHCARTGFLTLPPGFFDAWVKETAARARDALNDHLIAPAFRARQHLPGLPGVAHPLYVKAAELHHQARVAGNPKSRFLGDLFYGTASVLAPDPGVQHRDSPPERQYV